MCRAGLFRFRFPNALVVKEQIKLIKISTKCNTCNKVYHPGCANKVKKCCGDDITTSTDLTPDISPMTENMNRDISNKSSQQELLLKIIYELEAKNDLLMENNGLLRFKISALETEIACKNAEIDKLNKKIQTNIGADNKVVKSNTLVRSEKTHGGSISGPVTDTPIGSECSQVPRIVANAESSNAPAKTSTSGRNERVTRRNNMAGEDTQLLDSIPSTSPKQQSEEWTIVSRKRSTRRHNQSLVVGSNTGDSSVEGIEKFSAFHVSNLKPETTEVNHQNLLKNHFTSVRCERLTSKYPDSYSSFKVLIPKSEYEKALNGSNWPNRASVHRFFVPRKTNRRID